MKANELMIGDWVQGFLPDTYSQVYGVINECRVAIVGGGAYMEVSNEDIQPIPLTAEILEKNGWYVPLLKSWWEHPDITFWMKAYTDGTFELMIDEDSDISFCTIRFVHELQHALRLCGITHEIVL